jgi:hypothetical protein
MTKKKRKSKTPAKKTARKKSPAKAKQETNPAEVRKEVSKLVAAEAPVMAKAVIDEAKKGQLAPTKYLFEMASIYPPAPDGSQATTEEDCLAKILLDGLKIPVKPAAEKTDDTSGAAASEPAAKGDESGDPGDKTEGETAEPAEEGLVTEKS